VGSNFADQTQVSEELSAGGVARSFCPRKQSALGHSLGFSSLAETLGAALKGDLAPSALEVYQDTLCDRLDEAKAQLSGFSVPSSASQAVEPLLQRTRGFFHRLEEVLDLIEDYLCSGCAEALEEAISLLDLAQDQFTLVNS